MARQPATHGKPDDLSYIHVQIPVWMKKRAIEQAKNRGQNLAAYLKALIVADVGERKEK